MNSAHFDQQITIERKSVTQESVYGTEVITWVSLVPGERFWAQIEDMLPSRSEAVRQGLEVARNQSRIRIPYRDDVTSDMRVIVHGDSDVVMQIVGGPAELGRKQATELVVERYSS